MHKLMTVLLCLALLCISMNPVNAFADDADVNSLTITKAEPGTKYDLFLVETLNSETTYDRSAGFVDAAVDLDALTGETEPSAAVVSAAAETLSAYAASSKLTADATQTADANGSVTFSGLASGMYLIVGYDLEKNGQTIVQSPLLVILPAWGEDDVLYHDWSVEAKTTVHDNTTEYSVYKVWVGDSEKTRPTSIEVELIETVDGTKSVVDTVTLSEQNNWQYTWTDLNATHSYTVAEKNVPTGYTVQVTGEGASFTIRNTADQPGKKVPPSSNKTTKTSKSSKSTKGTKLPQTGQLWWPVILLAGIGTIFVILGTYFIRKERKNARS